MARKELKKKEFPSKWILAGILGITLLVYSQGFNGDILNFDDNQYFEQFPEITNLSWESIKLYFSKHYVLMYHPLPVLSFAVQYQLSGLNPVPLHWFNFLFHLINVVLVYFLGKTLTGNQKTAWLAALVFGIHPMGTEAVTWISARSSVMYTCFFLASVVQYAKYVDRERGKRHLIPSLLYFILALFSKANALPLPVVLLLIDWYKNRKFSPILIVEKLPFFALSILFGIIALSDSGTANNLSLGSENFNAIDGVFLSTYSLVFYLVQYLIPFKLSAIHVYPNHSDGILPVIFYLSPIVLLALGFLVWKMKRQRLLLFGFAFFLTVVGVTLQVIPSRLFMMADRYTYLPYVGISLGIGSLLFSKTGITKLTNQSKWSYLLVIWLPILCVITYHRNEVWNNTCDLVDDIIDKNEAHPYLARAYAIRAGIKKDKKGDIKGALNDYSQAIKLRPDEGITYFGRGEVYFRLGQFQKAKRDFLKNEALNGAYFISSNFLGGCEFNLGNYQSSIDHYSMAISLNPKFEEAYRNRGSAYGQLKEYGKAEADLSKAIELAPADPVGFKFRALVYLKLNNREKACTDLLRAKLLGANGVDDLIAKNSCENPK